MESTPLIMGILNVTPDSFSDGGQFHQRDAAMEHAAVMRDAGADIIDVGGESTRPGAGRVEPAAEIARTAEVVRALASDGFVVSIDTTRAAVAAAAVAHGAAIINDVSGGQADTDMAQVVAASDCRIVVMHWRGHSAQMYAAAEYDDAVGEVSAELLERVARLREAGVREEQIIVDPGIGFAKLAEHNWRLVAHLDRIVALGYPVLFGASRKSFLGRLLPAADGEPRPPAERDTATLATSMLAFDAGVWGVRVHDVAPTAEVRAVYRAARRAR